MTNVESPWAGRMPQVAGEHTMPIEEFTSIVAAVTDVLNGRVCCPEHSARIAVTAAAACLFAIHGHKLDTIDRAFRNITNDVMNNFRTGALRADMPREGE